MSSPLAVVLVVALLLLAALLAAAEAALSRLPRSRVAELAQGRRDTGRREAGGRRPHPAAGALLHLTDDPARVLATSTLVRVVAEAGGTAVLAVTLSRAIGVAAGLVVAVLVSGALLFVAVGVGPRTLGRQHPERIALAAARPLRLVDMLLGPLARLLVLLGNAVTPGRGFRDGPFATEAELRDLVDRAEESSVIDADERALIHSVFELGDTVVREVMVPRTDTVAIDAGRSLHDAMTLFLRSGFSRVPVVGNGLDDVRGVLYLKDVAARMHADPAAAATERVEQQARPATFVPESKPVDALLRDMQRDSLHVALVVDEYGGVAGLVTIEDVIEEIVGEISDEYDRDTAQVEHLDGGTYRVSARLPIDELGDLFGVELTDEEVDSVGGLLAKTIGRVPIPGAIAHVAGLVLVAERLEGRRNRIATVLASREDPDERERREQSGESLNERSGERTAEAERARA